MAVQSLVAADGLLPSRSEPEADSGGAHASSSGMEGVEATSIVPCSGITVNTEQDCWPTCFTTTTAEFQTTAEDRYKIENGANENVSGAGGRVNVHDSTRWQVDKTGMFANDLAGM